jgi:hypothetical protein
VWSAASCWMSECWRHLALAATPPLPIDRAEPSGVASWAPTVTGSGSKRASGGGPIVGTMYRNSSYDTLSLCKPGRFLRRPLEKIRVNYWFCTNMVDIFFYREGAVHSYLSVVAASICTHRTRAWGKTLNAKLYCRLPKAHKNPLNVF